LTPSFEAEKPVGLVSGIIINFFLSLFSSVCIASYVISFFRQNYKTQRLLMLQNFEKEEIKNIILMHLS